MGQVSPYLRKLRDGYAHYCPACEEIHVIYNTWYFDANVDRPTFQPSVHVSWNQGPERKRQVCHYFLTNGKIHFCSDCTHQMAGQVVDLPPLPEHYTDGSFKWSD